MYECLDCGYKNDINYMDVSAATDEDPYPVVNCPKCGGYCELIN